MDWPLRDLFLAFLERLKQAACEQYRMELLLWALLAPHQKKPANAPAIPTILK